MIHDTINMILFIGTLSWLIIISEIFLTYNNRILYILLLLVGITCYVFEM